MDGMETLEMSDGPSLYSTQYGVIVPFLHARGRAGKAVVACVEPVLQVDARPVRSLPTLSLAEERSCLVSGEKLPSIRQLFRLVQ